MYPPGPGGWGVRAENKISSDLAPPQFGEDQPLSTTRHRSEDVKPLTLSQVELRRYHLEIGGISLF